MALDLGPEGKGRFYGRLSSELQAGRKKEGVIERGGYAGMRSKVSNKLYLFDRRRGLIRRAQKGS